MQTFAQNANRSGSLRGISEPAPSAFAAVGDVVQESGMLQRNLREIFVKTITV